ncbi:hypothetical protein [Rehaibacterium terrae]|jgi:hypothetical protein|uniref:Uncharacterized protein n=1 Tax=Rehaibacterium terrae TaxID=1341696 RepID=A0A7W8DCW0_9GAMM|nr:hypothetical protein [Rehaibacterium terrae]MBB5014762.1 hypothetical protein [Rehaibacterium terrae]
MRRTIRHALLPPTVALALCACADPPPPPNPPERPQTATRLREAILAPQERARAVERQALDAAERRREQIEAASGD